VRGIGATPGTWWRPIIAITSFASMETYFAFFLALNRAVASRIAQLVDAIGRSLVSGPPPRRPQRWRPQRLRCDRWPSFVSVSRSEREGVFIPRFHIHTTKTPEAVIFPEQCFSVLGISLV
jgi:hypothetical protein